MDLTLIKLAIERLNEEVVNLKTVVQNQQQEISELRKIQRLPMAPEPPRKQELDELLDSKQVRNILNVSKNTLIRLVQNGALNIVRIHRRGIRFTRSAITDYINRQIA